MICCVIVMHRASIFYLGKTNKTIYEIILSNTIFILSWILLFGYFFLYSIMKPQYEFYDVAVIIIMLRFPDI